MAQFKKGYKKDKEKATIQNRAVAKQKQALYQQFKKGSEMTVVFVPQLTEEIVESCARAGVVAEDARAHPPSPKKLLLLADSAAMGWWKPDAAQQKALELQKDLFRIDGQLRVAREANQTVADTVAKIATMLGLRSPPQANAQPEAQQVQVVDCTVAEPALDEDVSSES